MNTQEQLYKKGFNSGYILAEYMPTLLGKLVKNLHPTDDFSEGLYSGKEEFEKAQFKNQTDELSRLRNKSKGRDTGMDRE